MPRWLLIAAVAACAASIGGSANATAAAARDVDVSNAPDAQAEVSIAADPSAPQVLVAGSMSLGGFSTLRAYTSTDGGATWASKPGPVPPPQPDCAADDRPAGDPVLGVDLHGRE